MEHLLELCRPRFSEEEMQSLVKACEFAQKVHEGQRRQSGEPYITHPIKVAEMLAEMGMDPSTIIAGLLHDTVEDGKDITTQILEDQFGKDIAEMVDGVTKLTQSSNKSAVNREEVQAENMRKMFLATANDVRVVIIKLTDRLHNMRTLQYCSEEKRIRKARETLEVYAPLAHRFGMGAMKCELEDLCFMYLYPDDYKKLKDAMIPYQQQRMQLLESAIKTINEKLNEAGIEATINGRPKHLFSVYRKTIRLNTSIDEIYDLVAIRVIVNTINDCYAALGIIHSVWKPMPGRFKDYIAMPKPNMYRSLHTTLFAGEGGMPFEVQIRTPDMHRAAEYGIAAHWMYKEGRKDQDELDNKMAWLREALEMEHYTDNTREFIENVRKDFFGDYVYVLTPQGKIIDLPTGSTPLDFAYRIHSNIGNRTQHAKVNGAIVRLDYKLKTNDVVEIITSSNAAPSLDWLKVVKTQQAKAKIRQWFKKTNREENIQRGRDMLSESIRRQGFQLSDLDKDCFADLIKRFNMSEVEDVYAAIGYGGITTAQVTHRLLENVRKVQREAELKEKLDKLSKGEEEPQPARSANTDVGNGVIVKGCPNIAVRFARCCSPLPGDAIIGYLTRGRGVSVHRKDCPNIGNLMMEPDRVVEAQWAEHVKSSYLATIQVVASERTGLLMEISQVLVGMNISITSMTAKTDPNSMVYTQLSFEVKDANQLDSITKSIRKIHSVKDVFRIKA